MTEQKPDQPRPPARRRALVAAASSLAIVAACTAMVYGVMTLDLAGPGAPGPKAPGSPIMPPPASGQNTPGAPGQPRDAAMQAPPASTSGEHGLVTALAPISPPVAPHIEAPAAPLNVDVAALKGFIEEYRKGNLAGGDAGKTELKDPAAQALLEWTAIRMTGRRVGYDRLVAFMTEHSQWPGLSIVQRRAEEALYYGKAPAPKVLAFFAERKPLGSAGKLALAAALKSTGRDAEAAALVREVWRGEVLSKESEKALMESYPTELTKAEHRNRMEYFLFKEDWASAQRVAAYAGEDYVKLAKARMAVARADKKAKAALDAVPAALREDTSYAFSRAHFLRKADDLTEAVKIHSAVTRDPAILVDGDEWWAERRILARKLLDAGDAKTAYEVVSRHGAESDARHIEAEFHAGWIALRFMHDAALARKHFELADKKSETPISAARTAYWLGRAQEALGDIPQARAQYAKAASFTTTYYGQIARVKIGLDDLPLRPAPASAMAQARQIEPVQAARLLYAADQKVLATSLMTGLAQNLTDPGQLQAVASVAREFNDARSMVLIGKAAMQRGYPLDMAAFPVNGLPSYEVVGQPVEKPMVYAIARQESLFDPAAMSHAGARGLMQLMPATAKRTATRAGFGFELNRLTSDPAYNTKIGARHLRELLEEWRGSYILAFAAYNAGGGNVSKWIKAYGDPRLGQIDPVDWVERIPFSETRNYVQRVMENVQVYRRLLGRQTATLISDDLQRGMPGLKRPDTEVPVTAATEPAAASVP